MPNNICKNLLTVSALFVAFACNTSRTLPKQAQKPNEREWQKTVTQQEHDSLLNAIAKDFPEYHFSSIDTDEFSPTTFKLTYAYDADDEKEMRYCVSYKKDEKNLRCVEQRYELREKESFFVMKKDRAQKTPVFVATFIAQPDTTDSPTAMPASMTQEEYRVDAKKILKKEKVKGQAQVVAWTEEAVKKKDFAAARYLILQASKQLTYLDNFYLYSKSKTSPALLLTQP